MFDAVLANNRALPADVAANYRETGADPIVPPDGWTGPGALVARALLAVTSEGTVRHDPAALAAALGEFLAG